ncbi:MAG: vitamin K epoxide reductase family protein, partial [Dehalococcoidia bacterium]|nr:vitamin K epoxide reductase family protein [Dehalococcoidia bacterium]
MGTGTNESAALSGRTTRTLVAVLALVGVFISGYLTYVELKGIEPVCLPEAACDVVLSSPYARVWGVPLALLGLLMYALLMGLGLLDRGRKTGKQGLAPVGIFSVALAGTLYSAYLFYLQAVEIHAFCTWCLASALVVSAILVLSGRRLIVAR